MKKLFLIRHAKSSWKNPLLDDFDRPLNKRGKNDAPLMGSILNQLGVRPDLIIASPAYRAKITAETIAYEVHYDKHDIHYYEDLYEASSENIIDTVKYLEDDKDIVFLVGHNPSLNFFAEEFLGFDENIPTCAVVEIEFDCDCWQDITTSNAEFISFEYPKKYKNEFKEENE